MNSTSAIAATVPVAPASPTTPASVSRGKLWTGWALSTVATLLLALDGVMKLIKPAPIVEGTLQLGYPESVIVGLGIVLLSCVALYAFRRTSILGAVLLTGYFGGAIATHVRVGNPLFTHVLFPVYIAALVWAGLWLREPRLRALLPLRN